MADTSVCTAVKEKDALAVFEIFTTIDLEYVNGVVASTNMTLTQVAQFESRCIAQGILQALQSEEVHVRRSSLWRPRCDWFAFFACCDCRSMLSTLLDRDGSGELDFRGECALMNLERSS